MSALLFDYGGTLDDDGRPWLDRFLVLYREEGLTLEREPFARAFYAADDALPARHRLAGLGLEATVELQARDVCAQIAPRRADLPKRVSARFVADCRRSFARNKPVLERLARRHRLGIVSNFYGNLASVLDSEGLGDCFSVVVDSAVVGALKPEPKIFQNALEALGARPSDAVMIGDSIARDMRGAEGLGLKHALITAGPTRCCEQALAAPSVTELEPLLR